MEVPYKYPEGWVKIRVQISAYTFYVNVLRGDHFTFQNITACKVKKRNGYCRINFGSESKVNQ